MAMVADVFSWIDTCQNAYGTFQVVYDVCFKVVTNFKEQRTSLMEEADFLMNERVKNISETVSTQPQDNLKGLKNELQEISNLFGEIIEFLNDVKDTRSGTVTSFLKTLLGKYRRYQKQFKEYTERLHDMGERLDQLETDVIPRVFDLQRLLLAQMQDMQKDFAEMRKVILGLLEKHNQPEEIGIEGIVADVSPGDFVQKERELKEIEDLLGHVEYEGTKEIECELETLAVTEKLCQDEEAKERVLQEKGADRT